MIKDFEEFLNDGTVQNVSKDTQRAKNILLESERKHSSLLEMMKKIGVNDSNANDYVEYCYNIIMYLLRAKMILEGYNSSGKGAHAAEVSFAATYLLSLPDADFLNELRHFRNGILYYGKRFDEKYAMKTIAFMQQLFELLSIDIDYY